MANCIIRESLYLGDGKWALDAVFTDETGTRSGSHGVEEAKEATQKELRMAVCALYGAELDDAAG
jgi:hypothetical protein